MKEYLSEYAKHLRSTYEDCFPDKTLYQSQESNGFGIKFIDGPRFTKVVMEIPTVGMQNSFRVDKKAHSFIDEDGSIYKAKDWSRPMTLRSFGNIKNKSSYQHLSWNRI